MQTALNLKVRSFEMYWDGHAKLSKVAGQGINAQESLPEISILRVVRPYSAENEYYLVVRPNYIENDVERLMIQAECIVPTTMEHYWKHMPKATVKLPGGRVGIVGAF